MFSSHYYSSILLLPHSSHLILFLLILPIQYRSFLIQHIHAHVTLFYHILHLQYSSVLSLTLQHCPFLVLRFIYSVLPTPLILTLQYSFLILPLLRCSIPILSFLYWSFLIPPFNIAPTSWLLPHCTFVMTLPYGPFPLILLPWSIYVFLPPYFSLLVSNISSVGFLSGIFSPDRDDF